MAKNEETPVAGTPDANTVAPVAPAPDDVEVTKDKGADDTLLGADDTLPNHTALLQQPNEKGAPDGATHFKVLHAGISVPNVQLIDGKTHVMAEGVYRGEIHKKEVFGDDARVAYLLGIKAIEPVKG